MEPFFVGVAVSIIASLAGGIFSYLFRKRAIEVRKQAEEAYDAQLDILRTSLARDLALQIDDKEKRDIVQKELMSKLLPLLSTDLVAISKSEVQSDIDAKTSALMRRIEQIEERLPNQSIVDKIASVNDAILATQVESLQEALKRLEEKMLSKWDVASIVFTVIAGLGGLVGLSITIIKFATP